MSRFTHSTKKKCQTNKIYNKKLYSKKKKDKLAREGAKLKITSYSRVPQTAKILKIDKRIKKSPILFTSIAFIAALLAWIRVNQKLISKNEDKPTPSQPTNICKKLLLVTNISIKKVNNDKYDIKRGRCGSSDIYSIEYKWTKVEIKVTTKSITAVNLSNKKDQLTFIS